MTGDSAKVGGAAAMVLHVCVTCGRHPEPLAEPDGRCLLAALERAPAAPAVELRAIECLGVCRRGCAVAMSAPGKWTYVFADLSVADAGEVLAGAGLYAASDNGMVPWRERPQPLRRGLVARIPPVTLPT